jgi:nuclear receptor coactivator 2
MCEEESGEGGPLLMCVARRISPNEKHLGTPIEQFTMKLDPSGKIINIDTTGISTAYSQFLNKVIVTRFYSFGSLVDEVVIILIT